MYLPPSFCHMRLFVQHILPEPFQFRQNSGAQVFYGAKGESKDLAVTLQSCFRDTLNPKSKRDAKKSEGIYLMEHIDCTGVLVECGFLSNYAEEAALRSGEYQKKICCVIAFALGSFLTK